MAAEGFGENILALARDAESHSDDELGDAEHVAVGSSNRPGTPMQVFYIKTKDGRSAKVKAFFRKLDEKQRRMAMAKSRYRY